MRNIWYNKHIFFIQLIRYCLKHNLSVSRVILRIIKSTFHIQLSKNCIKDLDRGCVNLKGVLGELIDGFEKKLDMELQGVIPAISEIG